MKNYLDSSFIVEVIMGDSKALSILSRMEGNLYSSQLGRTETIRALTRFYPDWIPSAFAFIEYINLIDIDKSVLRNVESYSAEISLKTADAIHLSTAQLLRQEEGTFITFDKKMAVNAKRLGLQVIS